MIRNGWMELHSKIGILGGTFNPVHNGHIHLARQFRVKLGLDRVLLVPVWSPPHKSGEEVVSAHYRLDMCEIASAEMDWMEVSDVEIRRGGKSYTADTLRELAVFYPDARLYLLMGADMFLTLPQWRNFPEIASRACLCCAARHEGEMHRLQKYARLLHERYDAECRIESIPVMELSSTQIRERIRHRVPVEGMVPPGVFAYIQKNGLYE